LELKQTIEIIVIDNESGEALTDVSFTLVLPNGDLREGSLDAEGAATIEDLPPRDNYPIILHSNTGYPITVAKQ